MALKTNWRQIAERCAAVKSVTGAVGSWRRRAAKSLGYSGGAVGLTGAGGSSLSGGNCHSWAGRIHAHITPPQTIGSFARRMTLTGGNALTGTWPHRLLSISGLPTAT